MSIVTCEFCETSGDFFLEEFDQVVLQFEKTQDWDGELALACKRCARRYRKGLELTTSDGRVGLPPETIDRISICFQFANSDPLFGVYLLGKPKYREGQRWIEADRIRVIEKQIQKEFEDVFFKAHGMSLQEWRKRWVEREENHWFRKVAP